jgi:hypothetical protein
MELFRRNSKGDKFIIIKSDVIHTYFDYNFIAIKKQLTGNKSLNNGLSGKITYTYDSIKFVNVAVLFPGGNYVDTKNENITDKLK